MSRPKRNQAALITALVVTSLLSAAVLRRYHANAAAGNRTSAEAQPIAPAPPNLAMAPGSPLVQPAAVPQTSPTPSTTPTVQTLKIAMYGQYVYPLIMYAQPGPTLLLIKNQTTQSNMTLACYPSGTSAASGTMVSTQGQTNSSVGGTPLIGTSVINLSPNTQYTFADVNNPNATGVIVVGSN